MAKMIVGIDEAGRGAWAGPLVIGAAILGDYSPKDLNDSKLLSPALRQKLAREIRENAFFAGLGWVEPFEIDRLGLTAATTLGIKRSIANLEETDLEIIIDGHINYLPDHQNSRCLIRADQTVPPVSAASIIAKVARDEYMKNLGQSFPDYGFENHVGYGTSRHAQNLKKYGVCRHHRVSFKPVAAII